MLILRSADVGVVTQSLAGYADTMQKAISYVNEHYCEQLPLDLVAQIFSLSKSFFSRAFEDVTGFGFSEYVTLVRLKNAERLLAETELPITEIAFRCGFNDSSYFSSVFRRIIGISPLKHRKNSSIS